MKISMYMLAKWLESEHPQAVIREGKREISGLRLFEEGTSPISDYLYVGEVENRSLEDGTYNILLMHHKDIIRLKNGDLNYVGNRILEAFEFFDNLEKKFFQAYYHENPEQEIISAVEELLGPCFIMQPDYRILAYSRNFIPEDVNEYWQAFSRYGEPTLQSIDSMRNSSVMQVFRKKPNRTIFEEPNAAPYSYGIASTYQDTEGGVIGYLVIADKQPISEYVMDMEEILMNALNNLQMAPLRPLRPFDINQEGEVLLANLLRNPLDQRSKDILNGVNRFGADHMFRIICINNSENDSTNLFRNHLKRKLQDSLITFQDGQMVVLVWNSGKNTDSKYDVFLKKILNGLLPDTSIELGISNPFSGVENCAYGLEQARFANKSQKARICFFADSAVDYLLSETGLMQKKLARHTAVHKLETYDQSNGTELVKTLKQYLYYERSVGKTAEAMFIHKNTVLYRIHQIRDMCEIDLENAKEREYLILSLMLSYKRVTY